MILFIPTALFWAAYEQQGNTIALWAENATDRSVNLLFWRGEIPVTWFQAFNPLMIFLFTPPLIAFWSRPGREPSTVGKLLLGCLLLSASYLIMAGAALFSGATEASWLWLLFYFVVLTIAELNFSPIGLSLISTIAPALALHRDGDLVLNQFCRQSGLGCLAARSFSHAEFFAMLAAVAAVAAVMTQLSRPYLRGLLPATGSAVT
jgi:POT family proton-dependent oligopeptide transporter